MNKFFVFALALPLLFSTIAPVQAEMTGAEIMKRNDEVDDGVDQKSNMTMTLINKKGSKRVREVLSYRKDYGKDFKRIMFFLKPADVKGTALMTFAYDDPEKDDDQWLYIPELRKIKRISSKNKKGYFMGTDLTYVDMGDRDYEDYDYKLLKEESEEGQECYVVESLPKNKKVKKDTGYAKTITWVRKDNFLSVRVDFYNKRGKFFKRLKLENVREIDGVWTPTRLTMKNEKAKHTTIITFSYTKFNGELGDDIFTKRSLKKGSRK